MTNTYADHVDRQGRQGKFLGSIQFLHCRLHNMQRTVTIKPRGRNMLIVGQNGSGKTSLLMKIHESLREYLTYGYKGIDSYKTQIQNYLQYIDDYPEHEDNYREQIKTNLKSYRDQRAKGFFKVTHIENLSESLSKHKIVFRLFQAHRKADIKKVVSAGGAIKDQVSISGSSPLAGDLEQHLVNLRVRAALAYLKEGDESRVGSIDAWFSKFERDIQYLFENDSVRLVFDADQLRYRIAQQGRLDYTFQELSSGYSAIFDIFGDLVVRAEYLRLTPEELPGIVIIDEIDAHLHVSLQRKILPFFIRSFPNIQFIVSTHSPFVLSSVDDVLIYDITSGQSALDLSMYSLEAITEGLLGVPPISKKLEETITKLSEVTRSEDLDLKLADEIIDTVAPFIDSLDDESKMHYEIARGKVLREKSRKHDV